MRRLPQLINLGTHAHLCSPNSAWNNWKRTIVLHRSKSHWDSILNSYDPIYIEASLFRSETRYFLIHADQTQVNLLAYLFGTSHFGPFPKVKVHLSTCVKRSKVLEINERTYCGLCRSLVFIGNNQLRDERLTMIVLWSAFSKYRCARDRCIF